MRISDWSSDVCSSDLFKWMVHAPAPFLLGGKIEGEAGIRIFKTPMHIPVWPRLFPVLVTIVVRFADITVAWAIAVPLYCLRGPIIILSCCIALPLDRKKVIKGKILSVRLHLVCCR